MSNEFVRSKIYYFQFLVILFFSAFYPKIVYSISLEYLNSSVFPTKERFENTQIGGLSGLTQVDGKYWAVSDDKGQFGEPRIYEFSITLNETEFKIKPSSVIILKNKNGSLFGKKVLDLEGISSNDKTFLIANEGLLNLKPREMPSILEFSNKGKLLNEIKIPEKYLPERIGEQKKGVRSNGSFEGISLAPKGNSLWVITEQPLIQEMSKWKQGEAGFSRLLIYKKKSKKWDIDSEWKYPLDLPFELGHESNVVLGQGCSEVLALGDESAIILERGVTTSGTQIFYNLKLFEVKINKNLNDSLLVKKLVFDFSTVKDKISDGKGLDNLEGIAWGPEVNGHKTLIFISDDNFTPLQRTIWIALKITDNN